VGGLQSWFEVRDLGDGIQLIAEPGHANSFLVSGTMTALLFDTGTGIVAISDVVRELTDLPLIVVNSHDHLDHRGGNAALVSDRDKCRLQDIAAHPIALQGGHAEVEAGFLLLYERAMREVYSDYLRYLELDEQSFFVSSSLPRMREIPDLSGWHVPAVRPTRALADGELIDLGGRVLRVLHTPGHAPDAICLYDEVTGALLAARRRRGPRGFRSVDRAAGGTLARARARRAQPALRAARGIRGGGGPGSKACRRRQIRTASPHGPTRASGGPA
jgi:glyoxylase-like metal-dependent hydrolase (beta-lactamase superfamily II)